MNQGIPKNIISLTVDEIKNYLKSGQITVSVVGIGRIGLPTALSFAHSGLPTIGVDINAKLVQMINSGNYPIKDEPGFDKIFEDVIKNKKFHATTDINEAIPKSDLVILSLPTPMDKNNVPDYSALVSVVKNLSKLLKPGSLIVIESTIEPGFVENELISIIENNDQRLKAGKDFSIATCPETANPGEILNDFKKLPRLVGGIDPRTTDLVSEIYTHVFNVEMIKMPDCKTANAAKLTANVFRDINIAFVNELAILFENLGIDILKVLEACDKKYNFQTHYPGAGVGGPCLPVNSYQILNSARSMENNGMLRIIRAARETNESMPYHVVELLSDALNEAGKSVKDSTIALLGLSYKPNVRDIQLSPVEAIIKRLDQLGAKIKIYDPYFKSAEVFSHKTEDGLINAITNADAAIIVTAHKEFHSIEPTLFAAKMKTPVLVDARGLIDVHAAKKAGLIFRGIGRGGV
ncbi:MAG: nucleotide sugar dehydrogenase [Thaumarchaeota archaeon]|nr:nucleotide sugar dehydrogenase [Nitrososphaerota archaeon]MBI3641296.1 nucleotide sugar dehydrogenase [Nitrososphaerota archaeon]